MPHRFTVGIRLWWRKRFGVMPLRNCLANLNQWFLTPLGQLLVSREQVLIDEQLRNLFGYHFLQLSITNQIDFTQASRVSHKFALHPHISVNPLFSARADFNHLPLSPNSIDLVLLHHVLDYSQSPHHVLRESASVLISHGHLIVVGFNPWSLFGLYRWLARFFSAAPQWRHQSLRLGRVLDWLAVLDFEPIAVTQGFFSPPCYLPKRIKYLQWMEHWGKRLGSFCGGFYLIVARKDSFALTPIKPQWQGYSGLRGWGVTKILGPATRHTSVDIKQ